MARRKASPSPESRSLTEQIRQLRQRGYSVREIARRTGISKSHVHDISTGRRGVSATRAAAATERLSRERPALAIIDRQVRAVDPMGQLDRQKIGRYMRAVQDARRSGNFRELRRRFKRTVIKTSEGEFRFETDATALHELDDAGLLQLDEVFHYEPIANAAA
jgi:transcriptional regulator with XRE-family HTH domain